LSVSTRYRPKEQKGPRPNDRGGWGASNRGVRVNALFAGLEGNRHTHGDLTNPSANPADYQFGLGWLTDSTGSGNPDYQAIELDISLLTYQLSLESGGSQTVPPDAISPDPIVVKALYQNHPLSGLPITFSTGGPEETSGQISTSPDGPWQTTLTLNTTPQGLARISHSFRREAQREPCSGKEGADFDGGLCENTLLTVKIKPDAANAWLPHAAAEKCEKSGPTHPTSRRCSVGESPVTARKARVKAL